MAVGRIGLQPSSPYPLAAQTSQAVPPHQVVSDDVLSEEHCHWIVDMSGRNVTVRVHALQSLNESLLECVDHHVFQMIQPGRLLQGLVNEKI